MIAILLAPVYLLANYYLLRRVMGWVKAWFPFFRTARHWALPVAVQAFLACSIVIAFFLPEGRARRVMKLIGNYWLGVLLYVLLAVIAADLLRLLLGLEKPDGGRLVGTDLRWSAVFQEDRLLEGLDAAGNLCFALGPAYDTRAAEAMLEELGLADVGSKPVGVWSGGMKRRLALARALLAPSEAIALDEPFTGLDDENRQRAIRAIRRAAETKPVLLVTHDREDLAALDARIIRLRRGDDQ